MRQRGGKEKRNGRRRKMSKENVFKEDKEQGVSDQLNTSTSIDRDIDTDRIGVGKSILEPKGE